MAALRPALQNVLLRLESGLDRPFGPESNPLRQLATLSFFLFWIDAVTGIYLYVFFETGVAGAYSSVESMTHEQWYAAGVMRSLHRYASDAMVVTMVLHIGREVLFDRYRGARWFTWVTGVPIVWLLFISGVSGYWLVWDQLAQYVATASMEWFDWLGIFGEPVANNFLAPGSLSDRFFSLLVFLHIFGPLFLLFVMWIHLMRLSRPKINPPRALALGCFLMLVVLSLAKPALSHPAADLAAVPRVLDLDWFYLALYPLFDVWGAGPLWGIVGAATLILGAMPWLPPLRRPRAAEVAPELCNGCGRCQADCPFGAVTLGPRADGRPFAEIAVVSPALCTSCGMCVGACPPSTPFRTTVELKTGIDLPELSLARLRLLTRDAIARLEAAPGEPGIVVFGCDFGPDVRRLERPGVAGVGLPCIAMLPPSFIDYVVSRSRAGVVLTGCPSSGCYHRLGVEWTEARLDRRRDPGLRARVPRERVRTIWAARTDHSAVGREIERFRDELRRAAAAEAGAGPAGTGP